MNRLIVGVLVVLLLVPAVVAAGGLGENQEQRLETVREMAVQLRMRVHQQKLECSDEPCDQRPEKVWNWADRGTGRLASMDEELRSDVLELKRQVKTGEISREQFHDQMRQLIPPRFQHYRDK